MCARRPSYRPGKTVFVIYPGVFFHYLPPLRQKKLPREFLKYLLPLDHIFEWGGSKKWYHHNFNWEFLHLYTHKNNGYRYTRPVFGSASVISSLRPTCYKVMYSPRAKCGCVRCVATLFPREPGSNDPHYALGE